jgi:predicted metal-binding protein
MNVKIRSTLLEKNYQVEVLEIDQGLSSPLVYERYESVLPVQEFVHNPGFRLACETCPNYLKNLSCPPHSPVFEDYLNEMQSARVICLRIPQDPMEGSPPEDRYHKIFRKARGLLTRELLEYRKGGFLVAGCGACRSCPVCALEEGEKECRNPDLRIYSLESLGTNLTALTRKCFDFDLEWSSPESAAQFVCAIGAVFSRT